MYYNKLVLSDGSVLFSNIISASLTTSCNSEDDITPGSVCASSVDVEFWVNSNEEFSITQGTTFTYYKVDDSGKETKIGIFTCEKPEKDGQNKYKFTAYDNVTLLDKDVSDWVNNRLSFPVTLSNFVSSLAKECGLSVSNNVLVNGLYKIQKFTANSVTGRDLMKLACQAGGCYCLADENGNLKFGWYSENKKVLIAPSRKNYLSRALFDFSENSLYDVNGYRIYCENKEPENIPYYSGGLIYSDFTVKNIDKVQIKQSDNDVGVVYPADEIGTNAIVIQNNILFSTQSDSQIRPCAQFLYELLKNISYVPCEKISVPETIKIKVGDILTVADGKTIFKTWVTSVKYSGGKCEISSVGNATRDGTSAVNNAKFNAKQRVLEINATVDELNVKASDLEKGYSELKISYDGLSSTTSDLKNNYTQLSQSVDGLNLTVVKNGEVRTKFAADSSSVTINSGRITFSGNTLVVNSDNFKLSEGGTVSITGSFYSSTSNDKVSIYNGVFQIDRKISDNSWRRAVNLWAYGANASLGYLQLYGPNANGSEQVLNASMNGNYSGGSLDIYNASGERKFQVLINGNGEAEVWINGAKRF